jgi:hypothetical protein
VTQARIDIPPPDLQIDFTFALVQIRVLYLQEALGETVRSLEVTEIDRQLADLAPGTSLQHLASRGLRGESLFPVPCVLENNPRLLGYYRLLLGFSQKSFYATGLGVGRFRSMEVAGDLSDNNRALFPELCAALSWSAAVLLENIRALGISRDLIDDLTLLTVGPQLRGGANVQKGVASIVRVFEAISHIVNDAAVRTESACIEIQNAAGRKVLIEFAPDPDIIIREEMATDNYRNIIAIEVKGGSDFSNIHNRIGEAEKSHRKARASGYVECWTVVNVDRIDIDLARRESPSTNRFYRISQLGLGAGDEYQDFMNRIVSLTGIKGAAPAP